MENSKLKQKQQLWIEVPAGVSGFVILKSRNAAEPSSGMMFLVDWIGLKGNFHNLGLHTHHGRSTVMS